MSQIDDQTERLYEILKAKNSEKSMQAKYGTVLSDFVEHLDMDIFEEKISPILAVLGTNEIVQLWNYSIQQIKNWDESPIINKYLQIFHKHIDAIMADDEIMKSMNYLILKSITNSEIINVDETKLFEFIAKRINLKHELSVFEIDSILDDIRYETMSLEYLLSTVRKTGLVENERMLDIITLHDDNFVGQNRCSEIKMWIAPSGTHKKGYRVITLKDITPKFIKILTEHVIQSKFKPVDNFEVVYKYMEKNIIGAEFVAFKYKTGYYISLDQSNGFFHKNMNYKIENSNSFKEENFLIDHSERAPPEHINLYVRTNVTF